MLAVSLTQELEDLHAHVSYLTYVEVGHQQESTIKLGHHLRHEVLYELLEFLKSDPQMVVGGPSQHLLGQHTGQLLLPFAK